MYDKKVIEVFLKDQLKLFPEKVAEDEQEAAEFLEDVCAVVCKNKKEVLLGLRFNNVLIGLINLMQFVLEYQLRIASNNCIDNYLKLIFVNIGQL